MVIVSEKKIKVGDSSERCTSRNADRIRRGQRIADNSLQQRTGHSERSANQYGDYNARQAQRVHNHRVGCIANAEDGADHLPGGYVYTSDTGAHNHNGNHGNEQGKSDTDCFFLLIRKEYLLPRRTTYLLCWLIWRFPLYVQCRQRREHQSMRSQSLRALLWAWR